MKYGSNEYQLEIEYLSEFGPDVGNRTEMALLAAHERTQVLEKLNAKRREVIRLSKRFLSRRKEEDLGLCGLYEVLRDCIRECDAIEKDMK